VGVVEIVKIFAQTLHARPTTAEVLGSFSKRESSFEKNIPAYRCEIAFKVSSSRLPNSILAILGLLTSRALPSLGNNHGRQHSTKASHLGPPISVRAIAYQTLPPISSYAIEVKLRHRANMMFGC
jgi:hypothetical protein